MAIRQLNRIKAVLTEKGRSNQWLAARLSKNEATVSRWCTNSSQPSIEMLYEIARNLDVDIRELLNKSKKKYGTG
jgi:transcriptional regulator with XRE-family HTH domain